MLNNVTIQGRLTRDVELRRTDSGKSVASFTLAVDRDYSNSNGERGCDFINCVAWEKTAEFVSKWFKKGKQAVVNGRLEQRSWTDSEGSKRTVFEVRVSNIYFCGSKNEAQSQSKEEDAAPVAVADLDDDDGYLPF